MSVPSRVILRGAFDEPTLIAGNRGDAVWVRPGISPYYQKSPTGWLANLYGGVQGTNGNDFAAVYIGTNEMTLPDLKSALWTYYMSAGEVYGVNMVIWLHNPDDNDKRVEVTQAPSHADLEKGSGWNAHELNTGTTQFLYYGENVSGSGLSSGTQYKWTEFQEDVVFRGWTIYRISLEYGWYSTGTFDDVWIADVKLNGQVILLKPPLGQVLGRETRQFYKATTGNSTTKVTLITPNSTRRIRVKNIFLSTASATASNFEVYFSTGANITSDTAKGIVLVNLDTDTVPSTHIPFGDDGPLGEIGEVVSMRTSVDITTNGTFVIVYKEE